MRRDGSDGARAYDRRYLAPEDKAAVLAEWAARRAESPPAGDLAGKGWPDPEIIPLCDELNRLPGVCTLQSCSGHGGGGHLWLWLDEATSAEFDRWGHVLARMPGIEAVSRKLTAWGQEITAVEFDSRFKTACESVSIFFRALGTTSGRCQPGPSQDTHCRVHRTPV